MSIQNHIKILVLIIIGGLHIFEIFADDRICIPMLSYPMEKVYLHLDNTSYLRGDKIWFKAYVVNADGNTLPSVSNTLYVELLNPGGEIIQRKIYKIEDGNAHGDFTINHLPFYSGYYEIRAYTKYMLNFGELNYFSRIIPIFDNYKQEGDAANVELRKRVKPKFQDLRKSPKKGKKVNLKFYPEGGYMVKGVQSCVAFEATDADGFPLDLKGTILTEDYLTVTNIEVSHEGKGMFKYTPTDLNAFANIICDGNEYKFKLPKPLEWGYVISVDNLTDEHNVKVRVSRSKGENKDTVGVILLGHGRVIDYAYIASKFEKPLDISFDKNLCCREFLK